MPHLQVKDIDKDFYLELKKLAASQKRSLSQEVLHILSEYLAKHKVIEQARTPARVLLDLAGSWQDERDADTICKELRQARRSSTKLADGL